MRAPFLIRRMRLVETDSWGDNVFVRGVHLVLIVVSLAGAACAKRVPLEMDDIRESDADWFRDPGEDPRPLPPAAPMICGEVRLSQDVREMQPSDGWVFVLARRSSHEGPLLAGIKLRLTAFPAKFCLSQKHLVSRTATFAGSVFLSARIDGDGLGSLEPGDFDGALRAPVTVGARDVVVTIDTFR